MSCDVSSPYPLPFRSLQIPKFSDNVPSAVAPAAFCCSSAICVSVSTRCMWANDYSVRRCNVAQLPPFAECEELKQMPSSMSTLTEGDVVGVTISSHFCSCAVGDYGLTVWCPEWGCTISICIMSGRPARVALLEPGISRSFLGKQRTSAF